MRSSGVDFTAIATGLSTNPYTNSFGMLPDYTPASLVELDAFVDEVWGIAGKLAEDPQAKLTAAQYEMAIEFGSYVGEVIRRTCGGEWRVQHPAHMSTISFPNEWHVMPINKVAKRMLHGSEDALYPLFEVTSERAPPRIDLAPSFLAHAERFATTGRLPRERVDAIVARLRGLATPSTRPTAKLPPGTRLDNCPKCARAASPGRIACIYCGGPLIVPKICAKCGRNNGLQARACMYCQAPL